MQRVFCNLCTIYAHNLSKSTIFIISLTIIYIFLQSVLLNVKKSGEKNVAICFEMVYNYNTNSYRVEYAIFWNSTVG